MWILGSEDVGEDPDDKDMFWRRRGWRNGGIKKWPTWEEGLGVGGTVKEQLQGDERRGRKRKRRWRRK